MDNKWWLRTEERNQRRAVSFAGISSKPYHRVTLIDISEYMLIFRSAIIPDCGVKNFMQHAMLLSLRLQIIKVASYNSDKNNPELYRLLCITKNLRTCPGYF